MKLLIVTPLFPPDTTDSAKHVKELSARLSKDGVTVLLYGHLPEKSPTINYVCVDKRQSLLDRVFKFTQSFIQESKQANAIILQNGPSVELPALLASLFTKAPIIFMLSDTPALLRTKKHWPAKIIHSLLRQRCAHILDKKNISSWPPPKPIIHPLKAYPESAMKEFEKKWNEYLTLIRQLF